MNIKIILILSAFFTLTFGQFAFAEYPDRPIQMVVPAGAGGGTDTNARKLSALLEEELGTSLAVFNVAGRGGAVGASHFIRSEPDGYSLFVTWNSPLTTVPLVQNVAYSYHDFTPIASISETAYVMCVRKDFPADTGAELLEIMAARPDTFTYGNDGIGGTMQMAAERIFKAKGIQALPVPFTGSNDTLKNFLAGHIDIYGGSISTILPYVRAYEAKCLLLTSAEDVAVLPQASGLASLGLGAHETLLWRAILGPKGLDQQIVDILGDAVNKVVNSPEYVSFLNSIGEKPNVLLGRDLLSRLENENRNFQTISEVLE